MLHDVEGRVLKMCNVPNPNILIWGSSGQGKTYFCCQKIEEEDTMVANLSDTLADVLHIKGFREKKWLRETVSEHIREKDTFNLPAFEKTLQAVYMSEKEAKTDSAEGGGVPFFDKSYMEMKKYA